MHTAALTFVRLILFASVFAAAGEEPAKKPIESNLSRDKVFESRVKEMNEAVAAKEKDGFSAMFAELDHGVRKLFNDFPNHSGLPDLLVNLASASPKADARDLVEKALAINPNGSKAKLLQGRLEGIGKPFVLAFTALDGREVDLTKMAGKVVLVDFWATWCGPCVKEMPKLQEIYSRLAPKGFEIVGVSLDYERPKLERFVAQHKIAWPQQFDGKGFNSELIKRYGILGIPTTFLVDKKGVLREATLQPELEGRITELLAE